MLAVPVDARSLGRIAALTVMLLTNVVGRPCPFQRTVELLMKPEPLTVKLRPGEPTTAQPGATTVNMGVGLRGTMVNTLAIDVPPPGKGVNTDTLAVLAETKSADSIAAPKVVPLMNVVPRLEPFQSTVELLMKPEPLMVKVKPGSPATAEL
jgi:hypothetical protein